jgi:anthranilate synthase component 1
MVKLSNHEILLRPIAGTRKRGKTPIRDKELELEMLNDPKECAEHLMLIDLGRNDVGRVANTGTVKVTDMMRVEK